MSRHLINIQQPFFTAFFIIYFLLNSFVSSSYIYKSDNNNNSNNNGNNNINNNSNDNSDDERPLTRIQSSGLQSQKDIADALYQIAQILQRNHEHSNLYERVALWEAGLTLSRDQNAILEKRMKELEGKTVDMNHKLKSLSGVLQRAEALEISTKDMMQNFEEKLSTLAGEILRLKSIASQVDEYRAHSFGHRRTNFMFEDTREVEIREKCISSLTFPFPNGNSGCWFKFEAISSNWTRANQLCQNHGGELASYHNLVTANLTKGNVNEYWISDESSKNNEDAVKKEAEELQGIERSLDSKHLSPENFIEEENPPIKGLNLSEVSVDIRSLPNLEVIDENIDRNIYVSNLKITHDKDRHASSLVDTLSDENRVLSKRSADDFASLSKPQDAVRLNDILLLHEALEEKENGTSEILAAMSDSSSSGSGSVNLITFLKAKAKSSFEIDKLEDGNHSCSSAACDSEGNCTIQMDNCSQLKEFWCRSLD